MLHCQSHRWPRDPVNATVPAHGARPSDPPNFDTAMAHLYRGEMHRMATWRQRLDITTNWAMVMALGMTTFALGSERTPPYILLLGLAAVAMCLAIEARRYQFLHTQPLAAAPARAPLLRRHA